MCMPALLCNVYARAMQTFTYSMKLTYLFLESDIYKYLQYIHIQIQLTGDSSSSLISADGGGGGGFSFGGSVLVGGPKGNESPDTISTSLDRFSCGICCRSSTNMLHIKCFPKHIMHLH